MVQQILYVDYAGGKFEYWYYSEGMTYKNSVWEYSKVLRFYRSQEFTKLVLTDEAKERI